MVAGVWGGLILKKGKHKNMTTGDVVKASDFAVGAVLHIEGYHPLFLTGIELLRGIHYGRTDLNFQRWIICQ